MANNFYTILTDIGLAKVTNSQITNEKIDLTNMAIGDGNGVYYNPTSDMTALRREVWRGAIGAVEIDENNSNWIVIETIIPASVGGFMVREVGIFDDAENLIAIGKYPETYKPVLDEGSSKDLHIRMIIEVSNASAVTLKVDPAVIIASRKYVDDKFAQFSGPIDELESIIGEVTSLNTTEKENLVAAINELERKRAAHSAEKASPTKLGHVMVGDGLAIASDGKLSVVATASPIPSGLISMWSGAINTIPSDWALCDGTNGTPNLIDRFIVGAGDKYAIGDTGGADSVALTTAQLPSHSHGSGTLSVASAGSHSHGSGTLSTNTTGSHTHTFNGRNQLTDGYSTLAKGAPGYMLSQTSASTSSDGSHSHTISGSTASSGSHSHTISGATATSGSDQAHENRPPYYALAYIMKI